ncbi:hypothetical protein EAD96_15260 [Micromonospora sp. BL1]|uniref:DUF6153 family protein n=1 Tax=Micromonospora sp. BL1 TaxID=2478709 RepID=UPI000EF5F3B2|nr:DUF6153 family protein [Micromonospora sp. BL1]RLQ04378.1 hypothetical protein EAD96_15260 [Micromonospora sp. BL1]
MGRAHPLLRSALFVAVAFGVFGMHTFGHPAGPDAAHASAVHASAAHAGTGHAVGTGHEIAAEPDAAPGDGGSPGHRDGLHAFTVCLAVLGGALILGVLALLRRRRRGAGTPAGPWSRVDRPDRGPPRRPIGLRLRAATVLRT